MTLAPFVATLGRGPGRSRSLTGDEAEAAMTLMLSGDAAPEAVGALLMLLRMKGETADEIAGFARAAQAALPCADGPAADLDWPSYAAGRSRGLPWFLLSARLVASAGFRVVVHGVNGSVRDHLDALGPDVPYLPLETTHPALFALLRLRGVLGLRSCVNTVCRMLNPGRAAVSVQGVFHPSYRMLQADAAALLGWSGLSVIKGGGGEFERSPTKAVAAFGLRDGVRFDTTYAALATGHVRLADGPRPATTLAGLWSGATPDPFAETVVISTAALALDTLGVASADNAAAALWRDRAPHKEDAA